MNDFDRTINELACRVLAGERLELDEQHLLVIAIKRLRALLEALRGEMTG